MMYETAELKIDILKRTHRGSVSIHITRDGMLEVRAPYLVPLFMIRRFIASKRDWILRAKQKTIAHAKKKIISYLDGSVIRLSGEEYMLRHTDGVSLLKVGKTILFPKKFLSKASVSFD